MGTCNVDDTLNSEDAVNTIMELFIKGHEGFVLEGGRPHLFKYFRIRKLPVPILWKKIIVKELPIRLFQIPQRSSCERICKRTSGYKGGYLVFFFQILKTMVIYSPQKNDRVLGNFDTNYNYLSKMLKFSKN
jgi:hypothetical protein